MVKLNKQYERLEATVRKGIEIMTEYRYNGFAPYGAADCFTIDNYTSPDGVNSFDGNATEEAIRLGYAFVENGETAVLHFPNGSYAEFVKR